MTIVLADARHTAEATTRPHELAFKTAEAESGQMIALDDAEGIVTAIVSVTGIEDEVADIIVPGAYRETLTKRRPKVCWAHSWEHPIGRVLHIEELHPGDSRLPKTTKTGEPWPKQGGALVATMQFNMRSDEGKQAFEAVRFYSETGECEYSIGYQVPAGKASRDKAGVRHIKGLELYELSVVLFGAHTMTGTLSIKAAHKVVVARRSGMSAKDALASVSKDSDKVNVPDWTDGVMVAVYPDPEAADKVAAAIAGPDQTTPRNELHVTLAYLGKVGDVGIESDDIVKRVTEAVEGLPSLTGTIGGIGMFPDSGDGAPTWAPVDVPGLSLLREQIADALGDMVATDHGFTPHMTLGYNIGLTDPLDEIPVAFTDVRVVYGEQDRRIPLGDGQPHDRWAAKSVEEIARLTAIADLCRIPEVKAEGGADRNQGNAEELRTYWVEGEGGTVKIRWNTPGDFTRCVGFLSEHMTPERAKGYCANRHKEATGMWPGDKDNKGLADGYDPSMETKGADSPAPTSTKAYATFPGTYEERMSDVHRAVSEALLGEADDDGKREWDHVSVDGTWDDRVIATRICWDGGDDRRESFEMLYENGPHGVVLSEPTPVEMEVTVIRASDDNSDDEPTIADALPLAENVWNVASALHGATAMQAKAGRVLSGANERRIRDAMETLLNVLSAAGVEIETGKGPKQDRERDSDPRVEADPLADVTSTAPAAHHGVKALVPADDAPVTLDLAEVNAQMRALGLPEIG